VVTPFTYNASGNALRDAIIVAIDVEWYEHHKNRVTELGIAIFDPRFCHDWRDPWTVLSTIVSHHLRMKPNAHMIKSDLCKGWPEKFQFDASSFVTKDEAKEVLR
jgi:hypothetical protein